VIVEHNSQTKVFKNNMPSILAPHKLQLKPSMKPSTQFINRLSVSMICLLELRIVIQID